MWYRHFSSGVTLCPVFQVQKVPGQVWRTSSMTRCTSLGQKKGDFHWVSCRAKRTSKDTPSNMWKNLHLAVDSTTHTRVSFITLKTRSTFRIYNLARVIVLSVHKKRRQCAAGSDQSVRVSPARLQADFKTLHCSEHFWLKQVSTCFNHLFICCSHVVPLCTKAERGAAVGEADV